MSIFRAAHPYTAGLKGGDTICIVKRREVTVTEGAVKLLYEENETEEILREMSRQAKIMENNVQPAAQIHPLVSISHRRSD